MDKSSEKSVQCHETTKNTPPNIDQILEKCGDFHRYQFMLLIFFCLVNILASMHYYSQTIISFIPKHW